MSFYFNQGDRPLPGYTIQRGVGRGGFGEVYYATSDGGKEIALKFLRENPQVELRGVAHCLNLKSPYLVALHDVKQNVDGDFFVVMEYVSGPSLRDLLTNEPDGLGTQKAAYFLREIGKGLAYLHDRGIVHRDLKPGNIFYEDAYVKIGDYGLAKIMAASQHSGQTVSVGTVHYMAPEVGSGNYDRTIDIYALGVILYEMLLGKVPFSGATMGEVLMKHLTAQPEVDALPAPFPRVIRKALEKDPKDRYQTVNEMMADVFAVEDINRSVASIDSMNLSRMAAAVAKKVRANAAVGARGDALGGGSSNVPRLGHTPVSPPPVIDPASRGVKIDVKAGRSPSGPSQSADASHERVIPGSFPQRTRLITGLLGVLLGPWGVHRFYTGHTFVGVIQIIATIASAGFAGLWGFIEGIRILTGFDFRDSLGRPLLEKEEGHETSVQASTPSSDQENRERSTFGQTLWGIAGVICLLIALGLVFPPFLAPPTYEEIGETAYSVNMFYLMYFGVSLLSTFGVFALWKAAHRSGMSFWRRTLRPGLICLCLGLMGCATNFTLNFAPEQLQFLGLGAFALVTIGMWLFWSLRGPDVVVLAGETYWQGVLARLFLLLGLLAAIGSVGLFSSWAEDNTTFLLNPPPKVVHYAHARSGFRGRAETGHADERRIVQLTFDPRPIGAGVLALIVLGSLGEAKYRRNLVRLSATAQRQQASHTQAGG